MDSSRLRARRLVGDLALTVEAAGGAAGNRQRQSTATATFSAVSPAMAPR